MNLCVYENPRVIVIRNIEANVVLPFKLNLSFFKWNSPLVSRTVLQLEFCEKLRSGFCYFFDNFAKKFL